MRLLAIKLYTLLCAGFPSNDLTKHETIIVVCRSRFFYCRQTITDQKNIQANALFGNLCRSAIAIGKIIKFM